MFTPLAPSHKPACSTKEGNHNSARLAARSDKIPRNIQTDSYNCRITRPLAAKLVDERARKREFRCRIAQED
jgi:hypothetical protein